MNCREKNNVNCREKDACFYRNGKIVEQINIVKETVNTFCDATAGDIVRKLYSRVVL